MQVPFLQAIALHFGILIMLSLPRFKESDELSLVFKFAFLVCSKHQFDGPSALTAGALERQQASSCHSTGPALSPRISRVIFCFIQALKFACSCRCFAQALTVYCLHRRMQKCNHISASSERCAGGFRFEKTLSAEFYLCHCCH